MDNKDEYDSRDVYQLCDTFMSLYNGDDTQLAPAEYSNHHKVPRHETFCKLCDTNVIENECNFLFRCSKYTRARVQLHHKISEILNYANDHD